MRSGRTQRRAGAGASLLLVVALLAGGTLPGVTGAAAGRGGGRTRPEASTRDATAALVLSRQPVRPDPRWRAEVLDQTDGLVYPAHVFAPAGVGDPAGLGAPGGGATTLTATATSHPQIVVDLGLDAGGYVELGVTGNTGATIRLGYSEARRFLTEDGDTGLPTTAVGIPFLTDPSLGNDDDPGGRYDDYTGTGSLRSPGIRGAERWISIELTTPGTVQLDYVRVREEHLHPTTRDYTGHFLSSDPILNRVWYAGAYTFSLDAFKDLRPGHDAGSVVVTDGAKRDRLAWLGDLAIENLLGDYSLRQGPQIIRNTLQLFSCQQGADGEFANDSQISTTCPDTPPTPTGRVSDLLPEYTAWWVVALHDYDRYTGDDAFARRMLPDVRRALGYFTSHLGADGLYATPPDAINWHPFDLAAGEDTHTNAVIYRALVDGAELERRLGAGAAAAIADDRAATALARSMLAHLWDPAAGAFLLNSRDPRANHTEDAQVEPVLDGILTGEEAASALRFVAQHLDVRYGVANGQFTDDPYMSDYISPYIGSTDLLARLQAGQTASALDLIRREWGHMVQTDPNTTLWEKLAVDGDTASYSPNQAGAGTVPNSTTAGRGLSSLAHGWSGGPIPALSGYILGIRPLTAGYRTWTVAPQPGDLRWAQGQAPTPYGAVVSRWALGDRDRDGDADTFRLTAGGPHGTTGTVAVPLLGRGRTIARNGVVVWRGGHAVRGSGARRVGDAVQFRTGSGVATYAWAQVG